MEDRGKIVKETEAFSSYKCFSPIQIMRKADFFLLIIAIFLSGCIGASDEKIAQEIADCKAQDASVNSSATDDLCTSEVAINKETPELCEKITDGDIKNRCIGITKVDAEFCKKISDSGSKTACLLQVAVKSRNEALCSMIEIAPLKDGCIISVASAKKDASLCDTISEETKKISSQDKICKAMITLDTKYCDEIATYMAGGIGACYSFIVEKKKDAKLCEKIANKVARDICYFAAMNLTKDISYCTKMSDEYRRDNCFSNYAISESKWNICSKISSDYIKDECYVSASIKAKDPEGCEKTPNPDNCLQNIADVSGDVSVCNKIKSEYYANACYRGFLQKIIESGKTSDCEKISGEEMKALCLVGVAGTLKDPKICEKIPKQWSFEIKDCYASAFKNEKDPDNCEGFKNNEVAWSICNRMAAKNAKNVETCTKIKHAPSKEFCMARVKNDAKLCENIVLGKWDIMQEMILVAECKSDIAIISSSDSPENAISICNSIRPPERSNATLKEMNDTDESIINQEKDQKGQCKGSVITNLLSSGNPEALQLCAREGGELTAGNTSCKIPKRRY